MIFLEAHARWLLVLHAILGAGVVAVSTHLFVWTWRLVIKQQPGRQRGVRWFAAVGLGLYLAQFALGNLIYPVYKVRVRGEYLDAPATVAADAAARRSAHVELSAKIGKHAEREPEVEPPRLEGVARAFDVKEHWIAICLPFFAIACALAWRWNPREDGALGGRLLLLCAGAVASASWFGAIVGLVVTSYRSIAAL